MNDDKDFVEFTIRGKKHVLTGWRLRAASIVMHICIMAVLALALIGLLSLVSANG